MTTHEMFDGRVQIYRRGDGKFWQCAARVGSKRFRHSTGEEALDRAKDVAEEWYLDLRGKLRGGVIVPDERTFGAAAAEYLREARVLTFGTRSPKYIVNLVYSLNRHLLPFFGSKPLSSVNRGLVQAYRVTRTEETILRRGKPPGRSTILQEIVYVRQVLKYAEGNGWITHIPNLSTAYMSQSKRGRRAWFSPEEYEQLYKATRARMAQDMRRSHKPLYEDLHDFVLFMANTGLRPDEAARLELRDVHIEDDYATQQTILVIDVRGKTGVGFAKSTANAVHPFKRLRDRRTAEYRAETGSDGDAPPSTRVFPNNPRVVLNNILVEQGLKFDRDGKVRTSYSLRHTYISMRLMEGANIHQIANNCRTSVPMIEQFYASHIKDRLDASAINVQRPRGAKRAAKKQAAARKPSIGSGNPASSASTP